MVAPEACECIPRPVHRCAGEYCASLHWPEIRPGAKTLWFRGVGVEAPVPVECDGGVACIMGGSELVREWTSQADVRMWPTTPFLFDS